MKKPYKMIVTTVIVILSILFIYSYFNLEGNEIDGVSNIAPTSSVTITKSYNLVEGEQNYVLDAKQIELLKSLIMESDFTRNLASSVRYYDKDMYVIKIDFNNSQDFLNIYCIGNEYISITNQFNGKHLKINNPNYYYNNYNYIISSLYSNRRSNLKRRSSRIGY
jgi:hypothetical protein